MFSFEQRKLIAQLERDIKKLGLTVDLSHLEDIKRISVGIGSSILESGVDPVNRMDIYLSERGCIFLTSDVDWYTNSVLEAFRIAKKFVEDYRKIDMEVTHGKIEEQK